MPTDSETQLGLVIADHGRRGVLETPECQTIPYIVRGRKRRVVCGDIVTWAFDTSEDVAIVSDILERKNVLERRPPGNSSTTEILASNLTCMAVVCAAVPAPDWFLIDRYICAGELMGCGIIIVANKADVSEMGSVNLDGYSNLGYTCLITSATTGLGITKLRAALSGQSGILVGQSGVGKSALINALCPGADTTVGSISAATAEGKHTTTASSMRSLPGGARLIDTPGVRDFIPAFRDASLVQSGFREISDVSGDCRFSNCQHLREPDCAVKTAVANGSIERRRYDSYKRVINSL